MTAKTETEVKEIFAAKMQTIENNFQTLDTRTKGQVKTITVNNASVTITKGDGTQTTQTIDNVANAVHANTAASATSATNAANATKATQDASGNVITATYATKAELSVIPKFAISVVTALPTADISTTTIYLLNTGNETDNIFTEYIYVNNKWEKLGTQTLDLTGYVQKTQTVNGKALNDNISLTASDVGAAAANHTHTATDVGAYTKDEVNNLLYEIFNSANITELSE